MDVHHGAPVAVAAAVEHAMPRPTWLAAAPAMLHTAAAQHAAQHAAGPCITPTAPATPLGDVEARAAEWAGESVVADKEAAHVTAAARVDTPRAAQPHAPRRAQRRKGVRPRLQLLGGGLRAVPAYVRRAARGMAVHSPEPVDDCVGGVYLLRDEHGEPVAIFKPRDEEPYAANNPKGFVLEDGDEGGMRHGIVPGGGALRERAAFLLDHGGFARVPHTELVNCALHTPARGPDAWMVGSLQEFVANDGPAEDFGTGAFPVHAVHRVAQLDLRIANCDRHVGNMLATREGRVVKGLIPIDHSFSLPSSLRDVYLEWTYWPQARQPFDAPTREYLASIDPVQDAALLRRELGVGEGVVHTVRVCGMLVQRAARAGLSPHETALLMQRAACAMDEPSALERAVMRAEATARKGRRRRANRSRMAAVRDKERDLAVLHHRDAAAALAHSPAYYRVLGLHLDRLVELVGVRRATE